MKLKLSLPTLLLASTALFAQADDAFSPALLKNAQKGNIQAMYDLAHAYWAGANIDKDRIEAAKWFEKSIAAGKNESRYMLDMSNLRESAFGYKLISQAENGDPEAMYSLGMSLLYPEVTQSPNDTYHSYLVSDPILGKEYIEKAAAKDFPEALRLLGAMYLNGDKVEKNTQKGIDFLRKSAEKGDALGQTQYGAALLNGASGKKDFPEGLKWIRKAADREYAPALEILAESKETGIYGETVDIPEAVKLYDDAINAGSDLAAVRLGYLYWEGKKVKKDVQKAVSYWGRGKAMGNRDAAQNLQAVSGEYSKQFPKIFKNTKKKALAGDKDAIIQMVGIYLSEAPYNSFEDRSDPVEKAVEWLNTGVDNNIADFYHVVALLYETGDLYQPLVAHINKSKSKYYLKKSPGVGVVTPNLPKALELYNRSIASNSPDRWASLLRMAKANYDGDDLVGGENNYAACAMYLKDAISILEKMQPTSDLAEAYGLLSKCYRFGRGVNENEQLADDYEKKSMRLGNITGLRSLQLGF